MEVAIPTLSAKATSLRFWYGASIAEFVSASAEEIVGQLTLNSWFDIDRTQAAAWLAEIELLQSNLGDLAGSIFFEFNIPRSIPACTSSVVELWFAVADFPKGAVARFPAAPSARSRSPSHSVLR